MNMRPILLLMILIASPAGAELTESPSGAFTVTHETVVAGTPDVVWAEFTGDVSGWWDHTQGENPTNLVIDDFAGGHFYEHFDEGGKNGVVHADIIYADAGRKLIMDGPLGFAGHPLQLTITIEFVPEGVDRTRVAVTCRGAGQLEEGWAEVVDRVWHHFLIERFQPWMEALAHGG
jgi:hypothetical protein